MDESLQLHLLAYLVCLALISKLGTQLKYHSIKVGTHQVTNLVFTFVQLLIFGIERESLLRGSDFKHANLTFQFSVCLAKIIQVTNN